MLDRAESPEEDGWPTEYGHRIFVLLTFGSKFEHYLSSLSFQESAGDELGNGGISHSRVLSCASKAFPGLAAVLGSVASSQASKAGMVAQVPGGH